MDSIPHIGITIVFISNFVYKIIIGEYGKGTVN